MQIYISKAAGISADARFAITNLFTNIRSRWHLPRLAAPRRLKAQQRKLHPSLEPKKTMWPGVLKTSGPTVNMRLGVGAWQLRITLLRPMVQRIILPTMPTGTLRSPWGLCDALSKAHKCQAQAGP